MAKKPLVKFEDAETSPSKWKKFISESKKREKTEYKKIDKSLKKQK